MSGGSHNYICHCEAQELIGREEDLREMSDDLAALGYCKDAAAETEEILILVRQFENRINTRLERLSPVWRALEWWHSGDIGEDSFKEAIEKFREHDVRKGEEN